MRRYLFVNLMVAAVGVGCGAPKGKTTTEVMELRRQLDALRRQTAHDQNAVQEMESRLFVCEDRLETARVAADRSGAEPRLPVVRKRPDAVSARTDGTDGYAHGDGTRGDGTRGDGYTRGDGTRGGGYGGEGERGDAPIGIDEGIPDGPVEIVYEGEAARDVAPKRIIRIHEEAVPVEAEVGARVEAPDTRTSAPDTRGGGSDTRGATPDTRGVTPDTRGAAPDTRGGGPDTRVGEAEVTPPETPRGVKPKSDPMTVYKAAYAALGARQHAVAIAGFKTFLELWPEHDYADNSQYWLGEAFYDRGDWKAALTEFRRVIEHHGRGNKAPDAMLKVGYCYAKLGEAAAARDVLSQVIEIHPTSDAAKLAAKKLSEMRAAP